MSYIGYVETINNKILHRAQNSVNTHEKVSLSYILGILQGSVPGHTFLLAYRKDFCRL